MKQYMKFWQFHKKLDEGLRKALKSVPNASERLMELADLDSKQQYYDIMNGRYKDPVLLQRTYDAAIRLIAETQEELNKVLTK